MRRTRFKLAENLIDRFIAETDPDDPQMKPKKDPMIDMPGTPGDKGAEGPFVPGTKGVPDYDTFGKGFGKIGS